MSYFHLLPLVPILIRVLNSVAYSDLWEVRLSSSEKNVEANRTVLLGLAGLAFAGIVTISVISQPTELQRLESAMFFLVVSFLFYFFALSIQGYKNWLGVHLISETLFDAGNVALIGFIVAFIDASKYGIPFKSTAVFIVVVSWVLDFTARLFAGHMAYTNMRGKISERRERERARRQ